MRRLRAGPYNYLVFWSKRILPFAYLFFFPELFCGKISIFFPLLCLLFFLLIHVSLIEIFCFQEVSKYSPQAHINFVCPKNVTWRKIRGFVLKHIFCLCMCPVYNHISNIFLFVYQYVVALLTYFFNFLILVIQENSNNFK